jgi:predicted O-linked N-acetylglucosamine transferase (SPINDLY family)
LFQCAKIYSAEYYPEVRTKKPKLSQHEKIHIGYVSGEFRHQATSLLMVNLFELHDKQKFKIFAFDNGWDDHSEIRQRLAAAFDEIIDISGLTTPQASEVIQSRKIDILINLNGFFGLSRQDVFAMRSSPIQVNYLGFPGTIGASYMDYLIADQYVIPPSSYPFYSEKIVSLPHSYQANDRNRIISDKIYSRDELGLPQDAFVFCCFNNNYKIQPETFSCWMRILERVPTSVLWLLKDNAAAVDNLKKEAQKRGIAPERLIFAERAFLPEHLARQRAADLFLDTLPYNAHTTASDALWAGLPVLTCVGSSFAGRVGSSLLNAVGLPELITHTWSEYEALAIDLATHPEKLAMIKNKLLNNRLITPLFDSALLTRHIETGYEKMMELQRAQLPCEHFSIQP